METWIWLSIAAAAAQTLRFALQKVLAGGTLTPLAATWARFLFAAPVVMGLVAGYAAATDAPLPRPGAVFWGYALLGGVAQVLATVCTVALFRHRAFAVGITFKKTEVMLTALVGFVILGDTVSAWGAAAIGLGFLGVLLLSEPPEGGPRLNRGAALGLLSGLLFALSAVGYRGATLEVATGDTLLTAGMTLALVTSGQALGVGLWIAATQPGQITATLAAWRTSAAVSLFSLIGSWCWFAAFALQSAAYVFAVGQVELIFSLLLGALWFGERVTARELLGIAFLSGSILALILLG